MTAPSIFYHKKFSMFDLVFICLFVFVLSFLAYEIYTEYTFLINRNNHIELELKNLQDTVFQLLERENSNQTEIKELKSLKEIPLPSTVETAEIVSAKNDMTKFYVKSAGIVVLSVCVTAGLYFGINHFYPSLFLWKNLLPVSLYNFIQNNTPYFQTLQTRTCLDKENKVAYLVKLINDKKVEILIKPFSDSDYVPMSSYLSKLSRKIASINEDQLNMSNTHLLENINLPETTLSTIVEPLISIPSSSSSSSLESLCGTLNTVEAGGSITELATETLVANSPALLDATMTAAEIIRITLNCA